MKTSLKGSLFVFISALLFGSYGIWSVMLGSDFGVFFQGYVRSLVVLALLVPVVVVSKSWVPMKWSDAKYFVWCCGFGVFTQAPLYYAFQNSGVGISSLIFFAVFLITSYAVGIVMLKEKMTATKLVSLLMAFVGLIVTFWGSLGAFTFLALSLAALNGVASGGEVATTKLIPEKFSAMQTSVLVWASILVTHLPLSLLFGEVQIVPAFNIHWLAMLCFALAGVLAFWLVIEGFKHVDASIGGLIGLLEIVFAVLFGVVVFHEQLSVSVIVGSVVILAAAMLPQLMELCSSRKNKNSLLV